MSRPYMIYIRTEDGARLSLLCPVGPACPASTAGHRHQWCKLHQGGSLGSKCASARYVKLQFQMHENESEDNPCALSQESIAGRAHPVPANKDWRRDRSLDAGWTFNSGFCRNFRGSLSSGVEKTWQGEILNDGSSARRRSLFRRMEYLGGSFWKVARNGPSGRFSAFWVGR